MLVYYLYVCRSSFSLHMCNRNSLLVSFFMEISNEARGCIQHIIIHVRLRYCAWDSTTGGNGYINDYPTGRFLRDAKLYEIGAGTSEVRRMLIGRALNKEYMQ